MSDILVEKIHQCIESLVSEESTKILERHKLQMAEELESAKHDIIRKVAVAVQKQYNVERFGNEIRIITVIPMG